MNRGVAWWEQCSIKMTSYGMEEGQYPVGKDEGQGETSLATITLSKPAQCIIWERQEQMAQQFWR